MVVERVVCCCPFDLLMVTAESDEKGCVYGDVERKLEDESEPAYELRRREDWLPYTNTAESEVNSGFAESLENDGECIGRIRRGTRSS